MRIPRKAVAVLAKWSPSGHWSGSSGKAGSASGRLSQNTCLRMAHTRPPRALGGCSSRGRTPRAMAVSFLRGYGFFVVGAKGWTGRTAIPPYAMCQVANFTSLWNWHGKRMQRVDPQLPLWVRRARRPRLWSRRGAVPPSGTASAAFFSEKGGKTGRIPGTPLTTGRGFDIIKAMICAAVGAVERAAVRP